jgi:hypothetical protein
MSERIDEHDNETTRVAIVPAAPPADDPPPASSRRELMRYGGLALGAAAAALAARPAEAADGDPLLLGVVNACTLPTVVDTTGGAVSIEGRTNQNNSTGVSGRGIGTGAKGVTGQAAGTASVGVYGTSNSPAGTGTLGFNNSATGANFGVYGEVVSAAGFAVFGRNASGGTAVMGELPGTTNQNGIAVYGRNNSSYTGPGPGAGGFGVYGLSARGHGLVGATAAAGGAAVVGATNGVAGAYAGVFYGPVVISGDFTVVGGAKSAAVPHPDGTHRRMYCVESPESWFEDVGEGQLACGQSEVALDPEFAALIAADNYHVFLTEYGRHSDLYVAERTRQGFRVEAKDATSASRFSWRVMAKRGDIPGPRLEAVTIPPEPVLPAVPDAPVATPTTPAPTPRG